MQTSLSRSKFKYRTGDIEWKGIMTEFLGTRRDDATNFFYSRLVDCPVHLRTSTFGGAVMQW